MKEQTAPVFLVSEVDLNSQFSRMGEHAINWNNVQYVKIAKQSNGYAFNVYLVGRESPLIFHASAPEAKALLNWWENHVPELQDGTERIPIG